MEKLSYEEWIRAGSPTSREEVRAQIGAKQKAEKEQEVRARRWGRTRGKVVSGAENISRRPAGALMGIGGFLLRGAGLVKSFKGIKSEDQMVKNKHLYFMGDGLNPRLTPLGRTFDRDNPMELYFGRRGRKGMPEGAQTVYAALQQGYDIEQLEVITGLSRGDISKSFVYLRQKGLIDEEGIPTA